MGKLMSAMDGVEKHVQGRNILMIDFMNMVFRNFICFIPA